MQARDQDLLDPKECCPCNIHHLCKLFKTFFLNIFIINSLHPYGNIHVQPLISDYCSFAVI